MVIDVETDLDCTEDQIFPERPETATAIYENDDNNHDTIDKAFGRFQILYTKSSVENVSNSKMPQPPPDIPRTPERTSNEKREEPSDDVKEIVLEDIQVMHKFKAPVSPDRIRLLSDGRAWVFKFGTDMLYLIDNKGVIIASVKSNRKLNDIYVHPKTQEVYCCCIPSILSDKSVRKIDTGTGKTKIIFKTKQAPKALAITNNSEIIVGFLTQGSLVIEKYSGYMKSLDRKLGKPYSNELNISVDDAAERIFATIFSRVYVLDKGLNTLQTIEPTKQYFHNISVNFGANGELLLTYNCRIGGYEGFFSRMRLDETLEQKPKLKLKAFIKGSSVVQDCKILWFTDYNSQIKCVDVSSIL